MRFPHRKSKSGDRDVVCAWGGCLQLPSCLEMRWVCVCVCRGMFGSDHTSRSRSLHDGLRYLPSAMIPSFSRMKKIRERNKDTRRFSRPHLPIVQSTYDVVRRSSHTSLLLQTSASSPEKKKSKAMHKQRKKKDLLSFCTEVNLSATVVVPSSSSSSSWTGRTCSWAGLYHLPTLPA